MFTLILALLLIWLAWIDLRTFRLPDPLTVAVLLLGAAMVVDQKRADWPVHLAGALAGFGALFIVERLYRHARNRDGLGRGDAKLFGALGMWMGWQGLPFALLIASAAGLAFVIVRAAVWREPINASARIPFGPFIALGGFVTWLLQSRVSFLP